jgi:hypothetical protein
VQPCSVYQPPHFFWPIFREPTVRLCEHFILGDDVLHVAEGFLKIRVCEHQFEERDGEVWDLFGPGKKMVVICKHDRAYHDPPCNRPASGAESTGSRTSAHRDAGADATGTWPELPSAVLPRGALLPS